MPEWMHETGLRAKAFFRRRRMKRDLADELAFHQAMLREKLERQRAGASGSPADGGAVDAEVRRAFGDARRWQERLTELWQFRHLENLLRDVSFGARVLRKSPGFTAVAILTLTLGIGANAAVFSLVNALLLRPLPVPHAEELALLHLEPAESGSGYVFSEPVFRAIEKRTDILQNVFAFTEHHFQVRNGGRNENFDGYLVSGQFFQGLGVNPQPGRWLTPQDDRPGGNPAGLAVVISDQFWKTWFNRAPDAIGRKLMLDNVPFTVAGVMPPSFIGADPTRRPSLYIPLAAEPLVDAPFDSISNGVHSWWIEVAARRRPGISLEQVNAGLRAAAFGMMKPLDSGDGFRYNGHKISELYPVATPGSGGYTWLREQFRSPLIVVFTLCAAVLLLACMNLASLLTARGAAREREMATRLAIGASRRRVIQQMLVESMLLAGIGSMAGLLAAPFVSHALAGLLGTRYSQVTFDTGVDGRVLLFAAASALGCTLITGLIPAVQASSGSLHSHARLGNANPQGMRRNRLTGQILMACEVALALIVVVGAGLLGTSLLRLYRSGMGFDPRGIVLAGIDTTKQTLKGEPLLRWYHDFAEAAADIPGVKPVSYADFTPLSGSTVNNEFQLPDGQPQTLDVSEVGPGYFATLKIPLLNGRDFRWKDDHTAGSKIILNKAAARLFFPDSNPVGRAIRGNGKTYEIIAVVGDTKYGNLRQPSPPMVYRPITQGWIEKPSFTAILRVEGKPGLIADALRRIASRMAPDIPAPVIFTLDQQIDESIASERLMAMLAVFFAVCALLVTGIGLYGTLAYATSRRTSEIGIRMALGARRGQVAMLVFRENAVVAIIGSMAGLGIALLAARALAAMLYNTSAHDAGVMVLSVGVLGAIACIASLLPALHAARIEPMAAIRCE